MTAPYISCFLFDCNAAVLGLAIPIYALRLGASSFDIGLIGTANGLAYALTAMITGRLFSRLSPRVLLLMASALLSLVAISYTLTPNFFILAPLSVLQSFSYGIYWPTVESLIADSSSPSTLKRSLLLYNMSWSMGWIVGPMLGGFFLDAFLVTHVFYLVSIFFLSGFILLAMSRGMGSLSNLRATEEGSSGNWSEFLRQLFFYYGLAFAYAFATRTFIIFFPVYATFRGIEPLLIGEALLFMGLTRTLVFALSGILERYLKGTVSHAGPILIATSMTIALVGRFPWHFALACAVLGFGSGISYFTSLSTVLGKEKGTFRFRAGLFEGTVGIGSVLGPLIGGLAANHDQRYPYVVIGLVCVITIIVPYAFRSRTKNETDLNPQGNGYQC